MARLRTFMRYPKLEHGAEPCLCPPPWIALTRLTDVRRCTLTLSLANWLRRTADQLLGPDVADAVPGTRRLGERRTAEVMRSAENRFGRQRLGLAERVRHLNHRSMVGRRRTDRRPNYQCRRVDDVVVVSVVVQADDPRLVRRVRVGERRQPDQHGEENQRTYAASPHNAQTSLPIRLPQGPPLCPPVCLLREGCQGPWPP